MAASTDIAWARHTLNFWIGCTEVSPACDHCYARLMAHHYRWAQWGNHPRRRTARTTWRQAVRWNRQAAAVGEAHRVFSCSLADFFDNQVPSEWRTEAWQVIEQAECLDWLVLTKRPQNIGKMLPAKWGSGWNHVWLGTTTENQAEADRRIPHLLAVPASVRFLSVEPMLGPVDLRRWLTTGGIHWVMCQGRCCVLSEADDRSDAKAGRGRHPA